MDQTTDHYARMGLLPSAEIAVVEAAYMILTARLRSEGIPEADRRLQELKIAYETILHRAGGSRVEADWIYALEFYPDLRQIHERLECISEQLAMEYKLGLLAYRDLGSRHEFAQRIEEQYFHRRFGKNPTIISFAREIIAVGKHNAASELSRACALLGDRDPDAIIARIRAKHFLFRFVGGELCSPEVEYILRRATENGFQIVVNSNNSITLNRSSSQTHFFSNVGVLRLKDVLIGE